MRACPNALISLVAASSRFRLNIASSRFNTASSTLAATPLSLAAAP